MTVRAYDRAIHRAESVTWEFSRLPVAPGWQPVPSAGSYLSQVEKQVDGHLVQVTATASVRDGQVEFGAGRLTVDGASSTPLQASPVVRTAVEPTMSDRDQKDDPRPRQDATMTGKRDGAATLLDGDAVRPQGGARRMLVFGVGIPLGLAAPAGVDMRGVSWPQATSIGVTALALFPLIRPGPRARGTAVAAVVGSLVASVILIVRTDHDFSLLETGALLLLLIDRSRVARRPSDWTLAAGVVVALLALSLRSATSEPDVAGGYLFIVLAMLVGVASAVAVATELRHQDVQRVAAVPAVRRDEIARELHDVMAQHVTGIVVATQAARTVAAEGDQPSVDATLAAIEGSGTQALGAMRHLVGVLRTDTDTDGGPSDDATGSRHRTPALSDLDELVRRSRDAGAGGRIDLNVLLDHRYDLVPELQAATYRMRERAQALGGYLAAGPRPDGGWTVYAALPLPAPEPDRTAQ